MKGFKDSTKTQYSSGGSCYAKGGSVKGAAKISKVMGEFKKGDLHSGSKKGPEVTDRKQAVAIALNQARKTEAKIPLKKADGGSVPGSPGIAALEQSNRDVGGMTGPQVAAAGRAIGRGNRSQAEEAGESALVRRKSVPVAPSAPLIGRRYPGRAGDIPTPHVTMKKGGLAVMPKGKK